MQNLESETKISPIAAEEYLFPCLRTGAVRASAVAVNHPTVPLYLNDRSFFSSASLIV